MKREEWRRMSEGGAESPSEENSGRKVDFWKEGRNKIHLQTFWQPVSASQSRFSVFSSPLCGVPTLRRWVQNIYRSHQSHTAFPPPGPLSCNYTPNHDAISPSVSAQASRRWSTKREQSENEVTGLFCCLWTTLQKWSGCTNLSKTLYILQQH